MLLFYLTLTYILTLMGHSSGNILEKSDQKSYKNYKIVRAYPEQYHHTKVLREALGEMCHLLKMPHRLGGPLDALCGQEEVQEFIDRSVRSGMNTTTIVDDVGQVIQDQEQEARQRRSRKRRMDVTLDFTAYQSYDTIVKWMQSLASANPSFVQLTEIGRSVENRALYEMKIGKSPMGEKTRAVWLNGGVHAREWIAVSTVTFLIDKLVKAFQDTTTSDCKIKAVQGVDWYINPIANPDGYEFSIASDRMWRKNRQSPPSGSSCVGVDLNRNFDVTGYGVGASSSPCSEVYKGTPDSEPETKAFEARLLKYKDNVRVFIDFHSYGQTILTSLGYTSDKPQDLAKLTSLGAAMAKAIKCVNTKRIFSVQQGAQLYPAGGATDDWSKLKAEIPYSYTIELPDTGLSGFILPPSQIIPVGTEIWEAVQIAGQEAARVPLGPDPAAGLPPLASRQGGQVLQ